MEQQIRRALLASVSFGCLVAAGQADAQDASSGAVLEEVIVTAEKREANLQSTAMAVAAISGEAMEKRQLNNIQAITATLPNVDFGQNLGQARIAIRGIAFENVQVGAEGRIAFHQDGVYLARPATQLAGFYDVERIEVLYGPQGTLYGRNATGGAINVITRDPGETLEGYLRATVGNYGLFRTEGAVGGPITDKILGRFAFQTDDRGGYGKAIPQNIEIDNNHTLAFRGKLLFQPKENFTLVLSADYFTEDDRAYQYHLISQGGLTPGNPPLKGTLYGGCAIFLSHDICSDVEVSNGREFWGVGADARFTAGGIDVRSITSYRKSKYDLVADVDMTSGPISYYHQNENARQFSQELRLSQQRDRFDWTLGGFYFDDEVLGATRVGLANVFTTLVLQGQTPPPYLGLRQGNALIGLQETRAYAVFGNARYRLTDEFAVQAGLRYSYEKKDESDRSVIDFATPFPPELYGLDLAKTAPTRVQSESWDATNFSLTGRYTPTDEVLAYATVSTGFKSGGFNLGNSQPPFNPEKITNAEVGLKADWFDQRLRTNLSAFYYWYKDLQVQQIQSTGTLLFVNAAAAHIKGIEAQITAIPIERLRIDLNIGLTKARYTSFTSADPARPTLGPLDLTGNPLNLAPDYTVVLAAEYGVPTSIGLLTLRGDIRWVDRVYFSPFKLPYVSAPAHHTTNLSARLESNDGAWSADLWVRNLEDDIFPVAGGVTTALFGNPTNGAVTAPRTYGVTLGYRF